MIDDLGLAQRAAAQAAALATADIQRQRLEKLKPSRPLVEVLDDGSTLTTFSDGHTQQIFPSPPEEEEVNPPDTIESLREELRLAEIDANHFRAIIRGGLRIGQDECGTWIVRHLIGEDTVSEFRHRDLRAALDLAAGRDSKPISFVPVDSFRCWIDEIEDGTVYARGRHMDGPKANPADEEIFMIQLPVSLLQPCHRCLGPGDRFSLRFGETSAGMATYVEYWAEDDPGHSEQTKEATHDL